MITRFLDSAYDINGERRRDEKELSEKFIPENDVKPLCTAISSFNDYYDSDHLSVTANNVQSQILSYVNDRSEIDLQKAENIIE